MCMTLVGCNHIGAVLILIFSMAINGAAVVTNLQNAQDLAPNFAGSIFGIISLIGGTTGFITPAVTSALIGKNVSCINLLNHPQYTYKTYRMELNNGLKTSLLEEAFT